MIELYNNNERVAQVDIRDSIVPVGDGVGFEVRQILHRDSAGPVLVFLHESLGTIDLWRSFPEKLARATGCSALVYNRLGYGRSSDEPLPRPNNYLETAGHTWLPRLLDALGIDDVILVGHSDGGSIGLIAAAALGGRARALVTMAAHIYSDHLTRAGMDEMARRFRETDIRERLQRYHGERTDELFEAWQTVWRNEAFLSAMDFGPWLADIRCPALIVQGETDEYGVPEQVTDIVAGIGANAEALFVAGAGHSPHLEKQDDLVTIIYDFLHRAVPGIICN